MDLDPGDLVLRMIAAAVIGALVGINRDMAGKSMGSRTLSIVAFGSAAVAVAAIDVPGIAGNPDALSRVVQGIVQGVMGGISFIGAGVIIRNHEKNVVEGLTTAATVWATAALGIACALGTWTVVIAGTVVALGVLALPSLCRRVTEFNAKEPREPSDAHS